MVTRRATARCVPPENRRPTARVHNRGVSGTGESPILPDKQTLRRQLRARRRSLALDRDRDRDADAEAIATAARTSLDTILLRPSRTGGHPVYGGKLCVAIYR